MRQRLLTLFSGSCAFGFLLPFLAVTASATPPLLTPTPRLDDACFSTFATYQNEGTTSDCNSNTVAGGDTQNPVPSHFTAMSMNKRLHVKGKLTCPSPSSYSEEYGGDTSDPVVGNGMCGNTQPSAQCVPSFDKVGPEGKTWTLIAYHARHKNDGNHGCEFTGGSSQQNVTFTGAEVSCDDFEMQGRQ